MSKSAHPLEELQKAMPKNVVVADILRQKEIHVFASSLTKAKSFFGGSQ